MTTTSFVPGMTTDCHLSHSRQKPVRSLDFYPVEKGISQCTGVPTTNYVDSETDHSDVTSQHERGSPPMGPKV